MLPNNEKSDFFTSIFFPFSLDSIQQLIPSRCGALSGFTMAVFSQITLSGPLSDQTPEYSGLSNIVCEGISYDNLRTFYWPQITSMRSRDLLEKTKEGRNLVPEAGWGSTREIDILPWHQAQCLRHKTKERCVSCYSLDIKCLWKYLHEGLFPQTVGR